MPEPAPESKPIDETPLFMATEDQLVDELFRRYEAVVLITEEAAVNGEHAPPRLSYCGGLSRAMGLLQRVSDRLRGSTAPKWTETTRIKTSDGDDEAPWRGGA